MKAKKLTLNQTWKWQLRMSRWIARQIRARNELSVTSLKREWLRNNWTGKTPKLHCFFCEYNETFGCAKCPGTLIDKQFRCNAEKYHYYKYPIAFYNKLVSLNRKRLKAKQKKRRK